MVPYLEGQAQGVRSLKPRLPISHGRSKTKQKTKKKDDNTTRTVFCEVQDVIAG